MAVYTATIAADADDGEENGAGVWDPHPDEGYFSGEHIFVGPDGGGTSQKVAFRFTTFSPTSVPQGSVAVSATLTLYRYDTGASVDPVNSVLVITGDDVDNSPALSSSHRPSSGWTDTTATANVTGLGVAGDLAINVTTIAQELFDRPSFGGNMAFKATAAGSDTYWKLNLADYDADNVATKARLSITTVDPGFSLTVDHAQACGAGQAINVPIVMPVTNAQAAGNAFDVALLFDAAYVIPVTHAAAGFEGQEIPFIYTLPGTDAGAALQAFDVTLLAQALITVDHAQAAASLEQIAIISLLAIQVDTAGAALQGGFINTVATGLPATSSGAIVNRRRRA